MKNVEVKADKKFFKRMMAFTVCGFAMCASLTPAYANVTPSDGNIEVVTPSDGDEVTIVTPSDGDKEDGSGNETIVTKDPNIKVTGDAISKEQGKYMADTVKNNKKVTFDLSAMKDKVVPADVFAAAKEAGTVVIFELDDYTISFDGKTITDPSIKVNTSAKVGAEETATLYKQLRGYNLVVHFDHSGNLPGIANVTVNVGDRFKAGDKVYLYYINADGVVEYQKQEVTVDENGNATFQISHCSDYVLSSVSPLYVESLDDKIKDTAAGGYSPSKVTGDAISEEKVEQMIEDIKDQEYAIFDLTDLKDKNVPADIFKAAMDAKKEIIFEMGDYSISFNGEKITDPTIKVNMNAKVGAEETDTLKAQLKGSNLVIHFDHSGNLPGVANVTVKVGDKFKAGDKVYLYYINDKGVVEYQKQEVTVNENGTATFAISHCSDYVLSSVKPDDVTPLSPIGETGINLAENSIAFAGLGGCVALLGLAVMKKKKA